MGDELLRKETDWELDYLHVHIGTNTIPTATVKIKTNDGIKQESSTGDGPVNAVFNAIDRALDTEFKVESYKVRSVTSGRAALGEVLVRLKDNGKTFTGRGVSTDIIEASAKAYLMAINYQITHKSESTVSEILSTYKD